MNPNNLICFVIVLKTEMHENENVRKMAFAFSESKIIFAVSIVSALNLVS